MSSIYRILCLSRDPAIDASPHDVNNHDEALAMLTSLEGHPHCDLVIGRYSYPLIEVTCPPSSDRGHVHSVPVSIDTPWLRLLLAAGAAAPDPALTLAIKGLPRCWSSERVMRLAHEL